ncbi:hypothetical protein R1sor_003993 [Riccia sorocarpa]|uniref:NB-ARC domain-containing protein n=1 Tax=Riccia sorocarpa TaxID=122646 RepID=A0ABD3H533_9MARC
MDIVFFHGLQLRPDVQSDAYLSTWRSRCDDRLLWPKAWLPEVFPRARVLTVSYDGSIHSSATTGMLDLYLTVENLLGSLLMEDVGKKRPMILVGHCFGGIIIEELCLLAHKKAHLPTHRPEFEDQQEHAFLHSVRGIFYYATPHHGSYFSQALKRNEGKLLVRNEAKLVKLFKVLNAELARINEDFRRLLNNNPEWQVAAVNESFPTDLGGGQSCLIVEEGSARSFGDYIQLQEDHFSICQPRDKNTTSFRYLVDFIHKIQNKVIPMISEEADWKGFPANRQSITNLQLDLLGSLVQGEILPTLETSPVLGLWGMGGIGKTTLSKVIFNQLQTQFEYTLFFDGFKETSSSNDVMGKDVMGKVLHQMHRNGKKMALDASNLSQLRGKKILVVLDDVVSKRDIQAVRTFHEFCSPRSYFIVTSRDRSILNNIDRLSIYDVKTLSEQHSVQLFRSYAFSPIDKVLPSWQYDCLKHIVSRCRGHPLVLEVLAKSLKSIDSQEDWEQTLVALQNIDREESPIDREVLSKLELSYQSLRDEEKQMFVDAATFFQDKLLESNGYRKRLWTLREAKAVWRTAFNTKQEGLLWRKLLDRAMVYDIGDDSPIKMHDVLIYLGQKLARELQDQQRIKVKDADSISQTFISSEFRTKRSKLYSLQVLVDHFRVKQSPCLLCTLDEKWQGSSASCYHKSREDLPVPLSSLHQMELLRYVQLECCTLAQKKVVLPKNVIIFHSVSHHCAWEVSFENSDKLVILSFKASELEKLPSSLGSLKHLRFLYLDIARILHLPESIGGLKSLQRCKLCCPLLKLVPNSFGDLESLQDLTLEKFEKLENLPESFCNLENLQVLDMDCRILKELPDTFGWLVRLQQLTLQCPGLESLPDTFGYLCQLQRLWLLQCISLQSFPDSFSHLQRLQKLLIWGCTGLRELPDSFSNLQNLQELTLRDCSSLHSLPSSFGKLRKLNSLEIHSSAVSINRTDHASSSLISLPDSFGELKELSHLSLRCEGIRQLPSLFGCLEKLRTCALECWGLESLPDSFVKLEVLEILEISSVKLTYLPSTLDGLRSLKKCRLFNCQAMADLPDSFNKLSSLQCLSLEESALQGLPDSHCQLKQLQSLRLNICSDLKRMPQSLGGLEMLQKLEFHRCGKLDSLPECLGKLKALQLFRLSYCDSLEKIPESLGKLKALEQFTVTHCANIKELPTSLGELKSLLQLQVVSCKQLRGLPESLVYLSFLYSLVVRECEKIERLPHSIGGLNNLFLLEVEDCSKLDEVPDSLGELKSLQTLILSRLPLQSIPSLFRVETLKKVLLSELNHLKDVPDVPSSCELRVRLCGYIPNSVSTGT